MRPRVTRCVWPWLLSVNVNTDLYLIMRPGKGTENAPGKRDSCSCCWVPVRPMSRLRAIGHR
jgi:hypothetical protein